MGRYCSHTNAASLESIASQKDIPKTNPRKLLIVVSHFGFQTPSKRKRLLIDVDAIVGVWNVLTENALPFFLENHWEPLEMKHRVVIMKALSCSSIGRMDEILLSTPFSRGLRGACLKHEKIALVFHYPLVNYGFSGLDNGWLVIGSRMVKSCPPPLCKNSWNTLGHARICCWNHTKIHHPTVQNPCPNLLND